MTQLQQALTQLLRMYEALTLLHERTGGSGQFSILSEGPLDEIRQLEETIALLSGRSAAEVDQAEVWIQVEGGGIGWPETPTSVLTYFLDALRKGITAATEWLVAGQLSTRPTKEVKLACDLRVVAMQRGSVQVGVRLPETDQTTLGFDETTPPPPNVAARKALQKYLAVASWAGSGTAPADLFDIVDNADLRRLLLTEVKRLVPQPRGDVQSVSLFGRSLPDLNRITLTKDMRARIDSAIDSTEENIVERHTGDLREIDLDNLSFTLRNVGDEVFQVQCQFNHNLYESALDALDRRIEVTGTRSVEVGRGRSGKLMVSRLTIVDDERQDE